VQNEENKNTITDKLNVFWFRRDLRLNDNNALYNALNSNIKVLPIFIFDKEILDKLTNKADKRVSVIYNLILTLQQKIVDCGSSLLVLYGNTQEVFEKLTIQYKINAVYTNNDYEPKAIERDSKIAQLLNKKNIKFLSYKDQVIFEKSEILKPDGKLYTVFTPYSKIWKKNLDIKKIENFTSENLLKNLVKTTPFNMPKIESIGFIDTKFKIENYKINKKIIENYHNTRNFPYIDGTSNLSVHLRFGTVSIRELVKIAVNINQQWLNELIWREFFMMILYHFPKVENSAFKTKYESIPWRNNEQEFQKWCEGNTGYPIVDAGMRQLNQTGLMHNRVRMIVASFLTKHLLIDWRWGELYFAEKLLDFELSSNNGNWQWASGSGCDAVPYFRIFNPYEQVKRFDPDLLYIKKWVSNLNEFSYQQPIVDHKFARERAIMTYKKGLNQI